MEKTTDEKQVTCLSMTKNEMKQLSNSKIQLTLSNKHKCLYDS